MAKSVQMARRALRVRKGGNNRFSLTWPLHLCATMPIKLQPTLCRWGVRYLRRHAHRHGRSGGG
jgi:hypothetical protein